jgi:hypothetical protein
MGLWLNIVQRYLQLQNGWEVFLNGQYKLSTLYTTSIVNQQTLQPRFVIATLEESFYGMNDADIPFHYMLRDATEYMLKQRRRWIRIRGADGAATWKTTYVLVTLATYCRMYVLEPDSDELVSYFADRGPMRFYDAFDEFALIDSLLTRIAEVVVE